MRKTFLIRREGKGGLSEFQSAFLQVPIYDPYVCSVRRLSMDGETPFELHTPYFNEVSHHLSRGIILSHRELASLANSYVSIQSGEFNFYLNWDELMKEQPCLRLLCHSSTPWQIITESDELGRRLLERGFVEQAGYPSQDAPGS